MPHAGGRPPKKVPTVRWEVQIDQNIAAAIELAISDPMKEKAKYGKRSQLIESLLRQWLAARIKANKEASAAGADPLREQGAGDEPLPGVRPGADYIP